MLPAATNQRDSVRPGPGPRTPKPFGDSRQKPGSPPAESQLRRALPFLLFLLQLALVGVVILWREATGRPYIVEARETRDAPNVHVWKVVGLKTSRRVIDQVADAIRTGAEPRPTDAEPVTVTPR